MISGRIKSVDPFYLTAEWRRVRSVILKRDAMCVECHHAPSAHCDHIMPRRLAPHLELDERNLRGLCAECHNTRSSRQYSLHASPVGEDGQPTDPLHPWNAGEAFRISMKGRERSPSGKQLDVIRAASASMFPGGSPPRSSSIDAMPVALPPARRRVSA